MENILEQFPTREAFDEYWNKNYVPLTYEDVREAYENYVTGAEKHIFLSDYEEGNCISSRDFMDNLSEDAAFLFQDTLTEVFYDKNPELYEAAFALYEEAQLAGEPDKNVAVTFHEEYNRLYQEFLLEMFHRIFQL